MASLENLSIYRGQTAIFSCTAKKNGTVIDLTGGTLRMTAKYQYRDADNAAVFALSTGSGISVISAPAGTFTITISPTNTSSLPFHTVPLVYDIRLTESGGAVDVLAYGTLTVSPNVTVTTP
jgi:hypothetical protein